MVKMRVVLRIASSHIRLHVRLGNGIHNHWCSALAKILVACKEFSLLLFQSLNSTAPIYKAEDDEENDHTDYYRSNSPRWD